MGRTDYFPSNASYCHFLSENLVIRLYLIINAHNEHDKVLAGFEKIDFKNCQIKYQKTLVTKVLNVFEHSPKKFWWSCDEN